VTGAAASPYRMPAPAPGDHIVWPAAFGTRFLVFADVEEEFDWRAPLSRANRATSAMAAFPEAHRRFADHGVGLVCMADHPIATDPRAVEILHRVIEDGRSAIGTQLHAWVTPPYADPQPGDTFAGNLPRDLEAAKLDTITEALSAAFGTSPLIYRAGRYGIGPHTAELLAARGYRIDSSVRAGYDYAIEGGPDFSRLDNRAYWLGGLIELPLSTVFTGALRRGGAGLYRTLARVPHGRGAFARAGLLERIALTPEDMPIEAALRAVRVAVAAGERMLTFSFHSPSLVPGHTPYVRNADDLARFWQWWERMFAELDQLGIQPTTLVDILAASDRR
jgi:hypothetical protein